MKQTEIIKHLTSIGIEPKQARVYLACLSLGGGTALDIAKESGLERTACYYYLRDLVRLGLLIQGAQAKNTYYPSDPQRIHDIVQHKQEALNQVMPVVTELFVQGRNRSQVFNFEGREGIEKLYRQMELTMENMNSDENVYAFSRLFEAMDIMPDFLVGFFERREHMQTESKTILPLSEKRNSKRIQAEDVFTDIRHAHKIKHKKYLADRYMPHGMSTIMIARDHVATIDFQSLFGTITISQSLAETWKGFHQYLWNTLKEK